VAAGAERLPARCRDGTAGVPGANGLPWWYCHGLAGPCRDHRLDSLDRGGRQWRHIGPGRAIGCALYLAADTPEPGVIQHNTQTRLVIGEPSGETTDRVRRLSEALESAGLQAPVSPRIRDEIWTKLWGNVSFNPVSALTCQTMDSICRDPGTRAIIRTMMVETEAVGQALGVDFGMSVDERLAMAEGVGAHKTSMLQDLERGRAMEIDALVASVVEVGRLVGVGTPTIDLVLALVKQRALEAGCYGQ